MNRDNNFDLLRLLAAAQVAVWHASTRLEFSLGEWGQALNWFAGVPIFFTISGFLVYASYERTRNPKKYFWHRFLRLYPGLWMCLAVTLVLLFACGTLTTASLGRGHFWFWLAAQGSFFQFYTPDMLRGWGCGTPNGALWTIVVEIQYYILVPFLFRLLEGADLRSRAFSNGILLALILVSLGVNYTRRYLPDNVYTKLYDMLVLPHLFYFLAGALVHRNWERLKGLLENRILAWTLVYGAMCYVLGHRLHLYQFEYYPPGILGFVSNLVLACWGLSFAFSYRSVSRKLLHEQDVSYGTYIYHMLVINTLIYLGFKHDVRMLPVVLAAVGLLAFLSWVLVERPALRLKNRFA